MNPDKFKLKTKSATIGIRGTVFFGEIKDDGSEEIACTFGAISVETPDGLIELQAGEMTSIEFGKAPTSPVKIDISKKLIIESKSGASENEKESGEDESTVPLDNLHSAVQKISEKNSVKYNTINNGIKSDLSNINDDIKNTNLGENTDETPIVDVPDETPVIDVPDETPIVDVPDDTFVTPSETFSNDMYGSVMTNLYHANNYMETNSGLYMNEEIFDEKIINQLSIFSIELYGLNNEESSPEFDVNIPITNLTDTGTFNYYLLSNGDYYEEAVSEVSKTDTDGTKITYSGGYGNINEDQTDIYYYLTWGTWSKTNGGINFTYEDGVNRESSVDNSTWVAGTYTVPSEVPTTGSASYNGTIEGFHTAGSKMTGTIGIDVNFASNTVSSNLSVESEDGYSFGSVSNLNGSIKRFDQHVEFKATGTNGSTEALIGGAFYGSNAKAAGGLWNMTVGSGERANGTFAASKE